MNILVLMKQVPAGATLGIDPVTGSLIRDNNTITNPPDERALELALGLGGEITLMSMGPQNAGEMLKACMAYTPVKQAVLLCDRAFAGSDSYATAGTISRAVECLGGFDLILAGTRAVDGETGQVGPEISAFLKLPMVPSVTDCEKDGDALIFTRQTERETVRLKVNTPCLATVSMGAPQLRPPSLMGLRRASKAQVRVITNEELGIAAENCGLKGSKTRVVKSSPAVPPPRKRLDISNAAEGAELIFSAASSICKSQEAKE